jgi:6-phosphogluconolactonase (cycloisomerase 2 family)
MHKSILFLAAATCVAASSSVLHASDSAEYVYVESNIATANGNSIYAFMRESNGHLQQIPGSPFPTGGAGIQYTGFNLGPFDSDQEIITNADHTLLFAVNPGSDSVAVFHIEDNGALNPVDGSPFPSGGADPVSLALQGNTLFIANQSGDFGRPTTVLPNYTAMRLRANGSLVPIGSETNDSSHSFEGTISTASGGSPSQAYLVPGSNLLFGDDFLSGLIHPFRFDSDGQLHALGSIALPATEFNDTTTPRFPLGLWSHPKQPILYVGYVTANKVGVYRYSAEGWLQFIRTVPNKGQGICWIRANNSGTRLYTTDTGTNQVSVYDTSDPEFPVEIQTLTLSGVGQAFQESLSEDGGHLYTISQRSSAATPAGQGDVLHTLVIQSDGTLAETAPAVDFNQPGGARPQGVAVVDR